MNKVDNPTLKRVWNRRLLLAGAELSSAYISFVLSNPFPLFATSFIVLGDIIHAFWKDVYRGTPQKLG